jgi:hypothetical protein
VLQLSLLNCIHEESKGRLYSRSGSCPAVLNLLTSRLLKSVIFWDMTSCRLVEMYRRSSETPVNFYQTIRRHIAEDIALHCHRRENLYSRLLSKDVRIKMHKITVLPVV